MALAGLFGLSRIAERRQIVCVPLERFGRSSLFVYWIHVELVYGYASWLWRGRLPFWGTVSAYFLFSAAMYGAVVLRDRARHRGDASDGRAMSAARRISASRRR